MKIREPVVVTGADGLLGRHMVNRLLREGVRVRALLMPGQNPDPHWTDGHYKQKAEVFFGDIRKPETLIALMHGAGTVCHNAAIVTDWAPERDYFDVNVEGTRNLLDLAVKENARFLVASSVTVYGDKLAKIPCDETTPHGKPQGNYSRTKQIQETLCMQYYREKGLPVTVIRPGNIIGTGSKPWIHDLLDQMSRKLPTIIGSGNVSFALCHVENVVEVFYLAMQNEKAIGQIYNGWDDLEKITWKQYVTDLAKLAGYGKQKTLPLALARATAYVCEGIWSILRIRHRPPVTFQALNQVASPMRLSNSKIKQDLGYRDVVDYSQALKEVERYLKDIR